LLTHLQELLHRGTTEAAVFLGLLACIVLMGLLWILLAVRLRRLGRRLAMLTRNADGSDLEEALTSHMSSVDEAVRRQEALERAVGKLQDRLASCVQRVNLVRYDAFEDVGGEQSFAVALLDAEGDGVLLSSIYTRQDVRIYAKSVSRGQASHTLSAEEQQALKSPAGP
jgi:hypothetical protein